MEFNQIRGYRPLGCICKKIIATLKLIIIALITILIQSSFTGYSQKVTFTKSKASFEEVFKQIRLQTGFNVLCDADILKDSKLVDIQLNNTSLDEALRQCLAGQPFTYVLNKAVNAIVIQKQVPEPTRIITGTIKDKDSHESLVGVTIGIKGSNTRTVTDINGKFSIKGTNLQNVVLTVNYIGYNYQEVTLQPGEKLANLDMVASNSALNEVVVLGYGQTKRPNVLGAVSTIKPEDIADFPVANLATALQGRLAGVSINQTSGKPGATTKLTVRNPTSLSSQSNVDPLYVIDGIIYDSSEQFNNLDATMVESISILKDASAAVYGARGANGVVLVKTKLGKPGKARITYQGSYGVNEAAILPKTLSGYDHAVFLNDVYALNNVAATDVSYYTPDELDYLKKHNYRWLDQVWQAASTNRHAVNISGGTDKVTYFGGASYYYESGNLSSTLYDKKYNLRTGINAKLTDNLTATFMLNTAYSQQDRPTYKPDQSDQLNGTMSALLLTPGWVPLYIDGLPVYYGNTTATASYWNPGALQNSGSYNRTNNSNIGLNAILEYQVPSIKGLSLRAQYGRNDQNNFGKEYYVSYTTYSFNMAGKNGHLFTDDNPVAHTIANTNRLYESYNRGSSYQLDGSVNYANQFKKHNINALFLFEQSESSGDILTAYRDGQQIPGYDQIFAFNAANQVNTGTGSEGGRMSYVGRLNYNFADKYLFEGSFRYEASPNFSPAKRWGLFPAVAIGWRISQEKFLKEHAKFIDDLKFRLSAGLLGNDATAAYQYKNRYSTTDGAVFGSTLTTGLQSGVIPNENITWEKSKSYDVGFDGLFFNSRLTVSAEFYYRHNYDMLNTRASALPTTSGAITPDENYGIIDTWGTEIQLGYNGNVGKDFKFNVTTRLGIPGLSSNKVIRQFFNASVAGTYQDPTGKPTGAIVGYTSTGIIRTQAEADELNARGWTINGAKVQPGFLNFVDINGDGKITEADITNIYTPAQTKGWSFPTTLSASWKGISFNTQISTAFGGIKLYDKSAMTPPTSLQSSIAFWSDHWTPTNPNAKYPRYDAPYAKETSTFWAVSATTIRISNMTLGYSLPAALNTKLGIQAFRLYLSGVNLWTLVNPTPYKDPASNLFTDYPIMRTISLGLNVSL